jgi:hypothetical protein
VFRLQFCHGRLAHQLKLRIPAPLHYLYGESIPAVKGYFALYLKPGFSYLDDRVLLPAGGDDLCRNGFARHQLLQGIAAHLLDDQAGIGRQVRDLHAKIQCCATPRVYRHLCRCFDRNNGISAGL